MAAFGWSDIYGMEGWKGLYRNHLAGAGAAPTHLAGSDRGSNADPKAGSGVLYL